MRSPARNSIIEYQMSLNHYNSKTDTGFWQMKIKLYDKSGHELNASVYKTITDGRIEYLFGSRSGKKGSKNERNPDYFKAMEVLLHQLRQRDMILQDIIVDSKDTEHLPITEKRATPNGKVLPIRLIDIDSDNIKKLRLKINRAVAEIGRRPDAKGVGNSTKKIRLIVSHSYRETFDDSPEPLNIEVGSNSTDYKRKSGPPPSIERKATTREPSCGFVYFLELDGGKIPAIKIGCTYNVENRIKELNQEIRTTLTNCRWKPLKHIKFPTEREAWEYEQNLISFLRLHLVENEKEIVSLKRKDFFQQLKKFDTENNQNH